MLEKLRKHRRLSKLKQTLQIPTIIWSEIQPQVVLLKMVDLENLKILETNVLKNKEMNRAKQFILYKQKEFQGEYSLEEQQNLLKFPIDSYKSWFNWCVKSTVANTLETYKKPKQTSEDIRIEYEKYVLH